MTSIAAGSIFEIGSMYLKRLELSGFKSFASKTALDFPAGITAIVGPNGSGKSNIIDAIRWLLGEREAKNIRGAKAEDLIFSGTPHRPRMGMAQATMVFDNTSKFFPVDYDEVAVTRKVSRDGTSQYFLNNAEVRLKDIIDFFAKARLGTKGLTIVNQGNSDIFVQAAPKERRIMIEEVLGLRQYQIKKHDAELKLENTKINLDKVKALTEEIGPHLRLLRRQASKWEKQSDLEQELRSLEQEYFGGKSGLLEKEQKGLEPQLKRIEDRGKEKREELKQLQTELTEVEKSGPKGSRDFEDFRKRQTEFFNRKSQVQKELGRLEAQIEFLLRQPKSEIRAAEAADLLEEVRRAIRSALEEKDFAAARQSLSDLVKKIENMLAGDQTDRDSKIKELEKSKNKLLSQLTEIDRELSDLNSAEVKFTEELRGFNAVFRKAFEAVETKKEEIQKLENEKNKLLFDQERINIRYQELENFAAQAGRKISEFASLFKESINFSDLEKRMLKLRGDLASIGELDPALMKEAQETEARYNFLTKQSDDLEKASNDLALLIKELDAKIHDEFNKSLKAINEQFSNYFRLMFGGGRAQLRLEKKEDRVERLASEEVELEKLSAEGGSAFDGKDADQEHRVDHGGLEVAVSIPRKKISSLDMLSGGEKSLVSIAALFALISVSPPPFLVLDEVDASLDEQNAKRFADLVKDFSQKTQFLLVTHNRATMEAADILYGITMGEDGTSRVLSLKMEFEEVVKQ